MTEKGKAGSGRARGSARAVNWHDNASIATQAGVERKGVRATIVTTPSPSSHRSEDSGTSYADLLEPCAKTIVIQGRPKGSKSAFLEDNGDAFLEELLSAPRESIRATKFHSSSSSSSSVKNKGAGMGRNEVASTGSLGFSEEATRSGNYNSNGSSPPPLQQSSQSQIRQRKVHNSGADNRTRSAQRSLLTGCRSGPDGSDDSSDPTNPLSSFSGDALLQQPNGYVAAIPHSWSLLKALIPMVSAGYESLTIPQIKLVDTLAATNALVWLVQALYALLVTRTPIRSTLGGLMASGGIFILTMCLRFQLTSPGSFNYVSMERAFIDFLVCCFILLLAVFTYLD